MEYRFRSSNPLFSIAEAGKQAGAMIAKRWSAELAILIA